MFCELKSVHHQNPTLFGTGCTCSDPAKNPSSFGVKTMRGNSGVMFVQANGTKTYSSLISFSISAENKSKNPLSCLCSDDIFTEMLEPDRILNDIAKARLIGKIWDGVNDASSNRSVIFEYDEDGTMNESDITSEELATGANMVPNHKYYQVRNVPGTKGMADGAMTAVINIYVKMTFKSGVKVNSVDHTGGYAVYKFSHPVYRGMCLQDGMNSQMQGCHYMHGLYWPIAGATPAYRPYFICAENVDDIPAQQSVSIGDSDIKHGLTKKVSINSSTTSTWAKKADYNASLLCYTNGGASITTGECAYLSFAKTPTTVGIEHVYAVVVGGRSTVNDSSARSVLSSYNLSERNQYSAGRFSIPHLQL